MTSIQQLLEDNKKLKAMVEDQNRVITSLSERIEQLEIKASRSNNETGYCKETMMMMMETMKEIKTERFEESKIDDPSDDQWILDSGCSYHICADKKKFRNYKACDEYEYEYASLARKEKVRVEGIGDLVLKTAEGVELIFSRVRHVPQIGKNLISIGRLDEVGYKFQVKDSEMLMVRDKTVMKALKNDKNFYVLQTFPW